MGYPINVSGISWQLSPDFYRSTIWLLQIKWVFETHTDLMVAIPSVLIGVLGIAMAWILYKKESGVPAKMAKSWGYFIYCYL